MTYSLVNTDSTVHYSTKEAGPIVLALAFVIAVGGVGAAAILMCGWGKVKNAGVDWGKRTVTIACK